MSSSSASNSLLPQSTFSAIKDRILNVMMSGFMEAKWGREVPAVISEELLQMYVLEYIALHALKQVQTENKLQDKSWNQFDTEYIDERIAHLQNVLGTSPYSSKHPYSAYLQNFRLNDVSKALRSFPDHKDVYDKIYNLFTSPSQFVTAQYFAKGVKRKGGRRKTQYRLRKLKSTASKRHTKKRGFK